MRIAGGAIGYDLVVAATPGTIEQLARDVALSPDPENALRALSALRAELDLLEPELVTRAVRTGASWSQVARALGVTKQAAHKKHRRAAAVEDPAATAGGPKILVTGEARQTIQLAREEARNLGQPAVGTEHILLGILRCRESHAVRALNALGVTLEAARDCLQPTIVGVPDAGSAGSATPEPGITPHARRILEASLREAVKRQEGYIGVEHLLLALLADSRNGATQTLEALRTTPGQIRRQLEREWETVAAASSAAEVTAEAAAEAAAEVSAEAAAAEVADEAAAAEAAGAEAAAEPGQTPEG